MKQFCIFFIVWVLPIFNISIVAQNNYYYYLEEKIDDSGVAPVRRKSKLNGVYDPRGTADYLLEAKGLPLNVGDYFSHEDVVYDNTNIGDVFREVQKGRTIEDLRDASQSVGNKIGNALINNVVIAGTTAAGIIVDGTIGVLSALNEGDVSQIWNNPVSRKLNDIQEWTRKNYAIHQGQEYQNKSIWQKFGTANFWSNLVQSLGYFFLMKM